MEQTVRYKTFLLAILLLIFFSCDNKDSYTIKSNSNYIVYDNHFPFNKRFNLQFDSVAVINEEAFDKRINSFQSYRDFCVDNNGTIFILCDNGSVNSFDVTGKHKNTFCSIGQGPGEAALPQTIFIVKDTVNILSFKDSRNLKFLKSGEFLEIKNLPAGFNSSKIMPRSSTGELVSSAILFSKDQEKWNVKYDIVTYTNSYEKNCSFFNETIPLNFNVVTATFEKKFTCSKNRIYIDTGNENNYEISVYDWSGEIDYKIRRNYIKTEYNSKEQFAFIERYKGKIAKEHLKYKSAINDMWFDDINDLLWVATSVQRTANDNCLYIDIFLKGMLQNTVKIGKINWNDYPENMHKIIINNGSLYFMNRKEGLLKVYKITAG